MIKDELEKCIECDVSAYFRCKICGGMCRKHAIIHIDKFPLKNKAHKIERIFPETGMCHSIGCDDYSSRIVILECKNSLLMMEYYCAKHVTDATDLESTGLVKAYVDIVRASEYHCPACNGMVEEGVCLECGTESFGDCFTCGALVMEGVCLGCGKIIAKNRHVK